MGESSVKGKFSACTTGLTAWLVWGAIACQSPAQQPAATPSPPAKADPAQPPTPPEAEPAQAATQASAEQPALQGYCPVSYLLQGKALKGDRAYQSRYVGELYYLSSAEAKAKFDTDPKKYLPQYDGLCTTALGGSYGTRKPGDPTIFAVLEGKVYLFASERSRRAYDEMPVWFIARAKEVFYQPALKGYCPASYVKRGEAKKGQPGIEASFRGRVYSFADEASKAEFLISPRSLLPQYDGYCAEGVSRGRRYPADPTQFLVRDGKAYLFYDAKMKDKFLATVDESVKEADAQWMKIKDEPAAP